MADDFDELEAYANQVRGEGANKGAPSSPVADDDFSELEQFAANTKKADETPSSPVRRIVGDTATALAKGVVGLPKTIAGMADTAATLNPVNLVATGIRNLAKPAIERVVGKEASDAYDYSMRPGQAGRILETVTNGGLTRIQKGLDTLLSTEQQLANQQVDSAKGVLPTLEAFRKNPSVIAQKVVESAPSMIAGGAIGRGIGLIAPKLAGVAGAAIGEGAVSAGQMQESLREQSPTGATTIGQTALAAGSGALTGVISKYAGQLAGKLGIGDIDVFLAGGKANPAAKAGFWKQVIGGMVSEGLLEEAPQSAQETMAQNLATGKPIMEGVGSSVAQGAVTGGLMGAGFNAVKGGADAIGNKGKGIQPPALPTPAPVAPITGPIEDATDEQLLAMAQNELGALPDAPIEPPALPSEGVAPIEQPELANQPVVPSAIPVDAPFQPVVDGKVDINGGVKQEPVAPVETPTIESVNAELDKRAPVVDDAAYVGAVSAGSVAKSQKMVDDAAKAAGYTFGPVYHGTDSDFTVFDASKTGSNYKPELGNGFYAGTTPQLARAFGRKNALTGYVRLKNPLVWEKANGDEFFAFTEGLNLADSSAIQNKAKALGHDGIVTKDGQVVFFDASQFKSAKPVEKDDSGNVIPLSQRFSDSQDIRGLQPSATSDNPAPTDQPASVSQNLTQVPSVSGATRSVSAGPSFYATGEPFAEMTPKRYGEIVLQAGIGANQMKPHAEILKDAVADGQNVSAEAVERNKIALPEGYTRKGDLYVLESNTPLGNIPTSQPPVAQNEPVREDIPEGSVNAPTIDQLGKTEKVGDGLSTPPTFLTAADLRNAFKADPTVDLSGVSEKMAKEAIAGSRGQAKTALQTAWQTRNDVKPAVDSVSSPVQPVSPPAQENIPPVAEKPSSEPVKPSSDIPNVSDADMTAGLKSRMRQKLTDAADYIIKNHLTASRTRLEKAVADIAGPAFNLGIDIGFKFEMVLDRQKLLMYANAVKSSAQGGDKGEVALSIRRVMSGESMGGNAGSNRSGVNFLFDPKDDSIVFWGNPQDAEKSDFDRYKAGRLKIGTLRIFDPMGNAVVEEIVGDRPAWMNELVGKQVDQADVVFKSASIGEGRPAMNPPKAGVKPPPKVKLPPYAGKIGFRFTPNTIKKMKLMPLREAAKGNFYADGKSVYDRADKKDTAGLQAALTLHRATYMQAEGRTERAKVSDETKAKLSGYAKDRMRNDEMMQGAANEVKAIKQGEDDATIREQELDEGDFVRIGNEWYRVKADGSGKLLQDGTTIPLEDFAAIEGKGVIPKDHPMIDMVKKEHEEQVKAEAVGEKGGWQLRGNVGASGELEARDKGAYVEKTVSVTPEQDSEYLAAAEKGDTAKAQAMVDAEALRAGYTVMAWHGGVPQNGVLESRNSGIFASSSKKVAEAYGPASQYYIRLKNPVTERAGGTIVGDRVSPELVFDDLLDENDGAIIKDIVDVDDYRLEQIENGEIEKSDFMGDVFIARTSNQVKLSDPIVRDDKGRIIPLSRRFADTPDVRGDVSRPVNQKLKANIGASGSTEEINTGTPFTRKTIEVEADPVGDISSIRREQAELEMEQLGFDKPTNFTSQSWDEAKSNAQAILAKDAEAGRNLVNDLKANPRGLKNADEAALLNITKMQRKAKADAAAQETLAASDSRDPARMKAAYEAYKAASESLREVYSLLGKGNDRVGTNTARALKAMGMLLDEQYDVVHMRAQREATFERPLTADEIRQVNDMSTSLKTTGKLLTDILRRKGRFTDDASAALREVDEAVKKYENDLKEAKLKEAFQRMILEKMPTVDAVKKRPAALGNVLHREADEARARMKSRGAMFSSGVDPQALADAAIIGAEFIYDGAVEFGAWANKMKDTFGEKIQPYLNDIKAAADRFYANRYGKVVSDTAKGKPRKPGADVLPGYDLVTLRDLFKSQVESGITDPQEALKNVHAIVSETNPSMTVEQVRDAFSEYGKAKLPSQDAVKQTLSDFRRQYQLLASIERVANALAPLKSGPQRNKPSATVRELQRRLTKMMKEAGIETVDPETQLATALGAIKSRLTNRIEELDKALKTGERITVDKNVTPYDAEATALKQERDELQTWYDMAFPKEPQTPAQRLNAAIKVAERQSAYWQKRKEDAQRGQFTPEKKEKPPLPDDPRLQLLNLEIEDAKAEIERLKELANPKKSPEQIAVEAAMKRKMNGIKEMERRIREKDFTSKPRTFTNISAYPDAIKANEMHEKAKNDYALMKEVDRLSRRPVMQKIFDAILATPYKATRTIKTAYDIGYHGRQGLQILATHPGVWIKTLVPAIRSISRMQSREYAAKLRGDSDYELATFAGLGLAKDMGDGNFNTVDDVINLRLVNKLPGIQGSVRSYAQAANWMRLILFKMYLDMDSDPNVRKNTDRVRQYARFVNTITGKGKVNSTGMAAQAFFAPSFMMANVETLTGTHLWLYKNDPIVKKRVAQHYVRLLGTLTATYAIHALLSGDDDDWKIDTDPRSSNFGALKFGDKHYWNPLGSASTYINYSTRLINGQTIKTDSSGNKRVVNLRTMGLPPWISDEQRHEPVPYRQPNLTWQFLEGKLSPAAGIALRLPTGKQYGGYKDMTPASLVKDALAPISVEQAREFMANEDADAWLVMSVMALLGFDVKPNFNDPEVKRYLDKQ
jgi:hypothetical protein